MTTYMRLHHAPLGGVGVGLGLGLGLSAGVEVGVSVPPVDTRPMGATAQSDPDDIGLRTGAVLPGLD
jgi:hypothetical protein